VAQFWRCRKVSGVDIVENALESCGLSLEVTMRKLLFATLIGLSVVGCQTPQQSAGTATGVVAGAAVGGPVGAYPSGEGRGESKDET
jgi:hypothetical protein